jgi:membrane dipeptidase
MRIIDMHCDTIMALMQSNQALRKSEHMIDLDKLQKGNYLLQCFAMFVPYVSKNKDEKYSPFEYCHKMS